MRVPLPWLREYCDPPLDVNAIEERLTMTGTKVEAIHHHGVGSADGFVIGRVLEAEQHPDADRLRVCRVDLGSATPDGPASIVCGAPNVAAGQTVAVALPGAVMPDGRKLEAAWHFDGWATLVALVGTAVLAAATGWLASYRILGLRPLEVLREE